MRHGNQDIDTLFGSCMESNTYTVNNLLVWFSSPTGTRIAEANWNGFRRMRGWVSITESKGRSWETICYKPFHPMPHACLITNHRTRCRPNSLKLLFFRYRLIRNRSWKTGTSVGDRRNCELVPKKGWSLHSM
jgi:hypothetical protein